MRDTSRATRSLEVDGLWAAARAGDAAARERLTDEAASVAEAMLSRFAVPRQEREDRLSEVHVALLNYLEREPTPPLYLRAFLRWRVRGVLRDALRGRPRWIYLADFDPTDETERDRADAPALAELRTALNSCEDHLNDETGRLLRLRYVDGLSLRAVAKREGTYAMDVMRRTAAGLSKLRRCLTAKGLDAWFAS